MSINIEELKRLHGEGTSTDWSIYDVPHPQGHDFVIGVQRTEDLKDVISPTEGFDWREDAELICYLRNNCEEIIEALEFARNRSEEKVR